MTVYTPVVEDGKRIMHFDVFSPGKNLCKCLDSLVLAIKMKAELDNYDHDTVDEWIASRGGMNKFASNYSLLDGAHFETALDALYLAFKSDVDEIVEVYVAEGGESSDGESSVDETDGSSVEEGDEVSMDSGRVNLIEDDSDGDVR
ncbi:hypothetical protein MPSEU_000834400 [Mayamaea pseudoterrestris]|nr:hypothetical protein MPSEU_000834400 [Mayamaea pseudoterrestris]